jgi:hypothetical protein
MMQFLQMSNNKNAERFKHHDDKTCVGLTSVTNYSGKSLLYKIFLFKKIMECKFHLDALFMY